MLVKELLILTKERPISEIAKESLDISEKTARKALKMAGCFSIVGQRGWHIDEDADLTNLEQSIYHFADLVKEEEAAFLLDKANVQTLRKADPDVPRKRHSFDLDVRLVKELKVRCVQNDTTLYEAVEEAIRMYLQHTEGAKRDTDATIES